MRFARACLERLLAIKTEGQEKEKQTNHRMYVVKIEWKENRGKSRWFCPKKLDDSQGQARCSKVEEARIWKGVLGSEVKVALNLERPSEQKGMSVNRLPATTAAIPWSEVGRGLQDSHHHGEHCKSAVRWLHILIVLIC